MGRWFDKAKASPLLIDDTAARKIPDSYLEEFSPECAHAAGCPHSADYLVNEFEQTGKLRVEFEGSAVYLVLTREIAETIKDGTVYTLSEWTRIAGLPAEQIRRDYRLSRISGRVGGIQVKERE